MSERGTAGLSMPELDVDHVRQSLSVRESNSSSFIHVCGISASGKSTVSKVLAESLDDTEIFPMDAYLSEGLWDQSKKFDHDSPDPNRPYISGISPEIWDMQLMRNHLENLRAGESVQMPIFDETVKDRVGYRSFSPSKNIVVEGGHAFSDDFLPYADYRVLVKAPLHDRLTRKIVRTHVLYGLDDVNEVIQRYLTKDEPVGRIYEPAYTGIADQVVNNPANPRREFAHLVSDASARQPGSYHALLPKTETGGLKQGEDFGIIFGLGSLSVRYSVDNKLLVQLPIDQETFGLLNDYYWIEE